MTDVQAPETKPATKPVPAAQKPTEEKNNGKAELTEKEKAAKRDQREKEKAAAFKEVAARRTVLILKTMKNLKNCANTNSYSFTEAQLNTIFGSIENALTEVKTAFAANAGKKKDEISINL